MENKEWAPGQKLIYNGKYFLGYEPDDTEMEYIEPDTGSVYGIWVLYKGDKVVVDIMDVVISKN